MQLISQQHPISRLLIVDDDEAQLHTLCRMMQHEGFDVIGCRTAAQALELIKRETLSVAVIDYRLPDLTGTQLLAEIRKANGRIHVIIHTAYGSFESARDAVNLRAFAYVEKASDPTKLIRNVHQAFRAGFDRYTKDLEDGIAEHASMLRVSEEKYRILVQTMNEGLIMQDSDRRITYVNERLCEMWGYEREELIGHPISCFFDEDANRFLNERWTTRKEGDRSSYQLQLTRKDGRLIHAIVAPQPIFDFDHRLDGSFAVITDITEWKKDKESLQEAHDNLDRRVQERTSELTDAIHRLQLEVSERRRAEETVVNLAKLADENPSPVFRVASSGVILYTNPAGEILLSAWQNKSGNKLPESMRLAIEDALKSGVSRELEIDVGDRIFWIIFRPVTEGDYVNLYARDITQRRHAEEQLRQSQKMEAVGTLASGIAHEFDNLLTAIFSYTDLAKQTLPDDHQAVRALEKVEQTAKLARGASLALLTFSHQAAFKKKIINLTDTLAETVELLARLMPNTIEIIDDINPEKDLWIKADAGQIQQVLMNLALNARDAMPDGGELRVSLREIAASQTPSSEINPMTHDRRVVLRVEDTGMGMSEDILPRIFEPFFTTKPRGRGTGLGMSITHKIVEDLGGNIDVKSEINQGTRITITLPCCQPSADSTVALPGKRVDRGSGKLIVIIEQNEHVRSIMTTTLRTRGYTVVSASNIEEALSEIRNRTRSIGLLIFDLDAVDQEGLARLRNMRSSQKAIPMVIVAGTLTINLNTYGIEDGLLLRKPFQMKDLVTMVSHLLSDSKHGESLKL